MPDVCQVRGCRGESKYCRGYALFNVPTDPDLREKWLDFLGFPPSSNLVKSAKVCSYHFEDKFIKQNQKRVRLYPSAVPSLHPPEVVSGARDVRNRCTRVTSVHEIKPNVEFVNCSLHSDSDECDLKENSLFDLGRHNVFSDPLAV